MARFDSFVARRQNPLCRHYRIAPDDAWIADTAATVGGADTDPFHGRVTAGSSMPAHVDFGIHRAVGGDHDRPNPGDILSAALAACLDSTLRIVADHLGIEILDLRVQVTASLDVRGTLLVDPSVPVGFQTMLCTVDLTVPADTDHRALERLTAATERSCPNLQTLRGGVDVRTEFRLARDEPAPQP